MWQVELARLVAKSIFGLVAIIVSAIWLYANINGVTVYETLNTILLIVSEFNNNYGDGVARIVGLIVTILTALYGLYQAYRTSSSQMPRRIQEFLQYNDQRLQEARPELLQSILGHSHRNRARPPLALVGPLNDAFKAIGLGKIDKALPDLHRSTIELANKINSSKEYEHQLKRQLVTAHLLRGVALAARATMVPPEERKRLDEDAYKEFNKATQSDDQDPEPFYYRGAQCVRLGWLDNADGDLSKCVELIEELVEKTVNPNEHLQWIQAQALFLRAKIAVDSPKPAYQNAKNYMATCIASIPMTQKDSRQVAEMHEFRGCVNLRLNNLNVVKQAFNSAYAIYQLNGDREGAERVQRRMQALEVSESAPELPAKCWPLDQVSQTQAENLPSP